MSHSAETEHAKHCPTCVCGRRAPVHGDNRWQLPESHPERPATAHGPGTVAWWEHEAAWSMYAVRYGSGQSAERMAERGGFSYGELIMFLGHEPTTWAVAGRGGA